MSHSSSPNNRSSIFGWAKSLKKSHFLSNDSVNEISDTDSIGKSPSKSLSISTNFHNSSTQPQSIPFPQTLSSISSLPQNNPQSPPPSNQNHHSALNNYFSTSPNSASDFLRPLLNHRSRSANNVSRVRSNSLNQSETSVRQHSKYFGVPLQQALSEASAKISILATDQGDGLNYGQIPIVVAKCGVFLKKNGLTVEGIFRVGGSSKRIKELQNTFNSPPHYGKKLNWEGYTVHDAASVLRRYLNALPEPLIPLEMYEMFREPLRSRSRIISYMKYKAENPCKALPKEAPTSSSSIVNNNNNNNVLDSSQLLTEANVGRLNNDNTPRKNSEASSNIFSQTQTGGQQLSEEEINLRNKKKSKNYKKLTNDIHGAIDEYKSLVNALPVASKQLLFYILDLLAMVQNHSKENLMSSRNLAAIFQPSILSHPNHDMDPIEYALSQSVVEFLIQYAYKLLPKTALPTNMIPSNFVPPPESDVTSTSTSPLGEESHLSKENYQRHTSISSGPGRTPNHDDLGFRHNVTGSLPFDSDIESDIGSDLDELHFQQLKLNEGSPVKVHPGTNSSSSDTPVPSVVVVTAPSSSSINK
ncbi:SAC7 GTPase-activating protein SAC7 [Candida maltosa Xu316]